MITIPEPWAQNATMSQKIKDFYQFTPDDVKLEGYQTGEQIRDIPIAI
jgi:thymidylate synthase